jgi:hypothetical protein
MVLYELGSLGSEAKVIRSSKTETDRPYDGCVLSPQASAIEELHDWSLNFDTGLNPYCLFVDIIGYSADRWGTYAYCHDLKDCGEIFGYKELCLLGDALKVFENHGYDDVYTWCDALNESEHED